MHTLEGIHVDDVYYKVGDVLLAKTEKSLADAYPWYGDWTPVKIVIEQPLYYVCEALEHMNKHTIFGPSKSYRITIDKRDILLGEIKVRFR